jgi:hypothetical protein
MKNVLAFIGSIVLAFISAIALLIMVTSAKDVAGRNSESSVDYFNTQVPLKQKKIAVVNTQEMANKYVKNGWVLQDVDITSCINNHKTSPYVKIIYTLIKY